MKIGDINVVVLYNSQGKLRLKSENCKRGYEMRVFDDRDTFRLRDIFQCSEWGNKTNLGCVIIDPFLECNFVYKNYLVSAYFSKQSGYFEYVDYSGTSDCDPHYVGIRCNKTEIQKVASLLKGEGAEKVVYGRDVNFSKLIRIAEKTRTEETAQKVQDFFNLSVEEQKRKLEDILKI